MRGFERAYHLWEMPGGYARKQEKLTAIGSENFNLKSVFFHFFCHLVVDVHCKRSFCFSLYHL